MAVASLTIELGNADDVEAVWSVDAAAFPVPWSRQLLVDDLTRDNRHHLVARLGPELVGHASLMTVADEGHVTTVAVHPDHQRMGIARALMLGLCRFAVSTGLEALTLEVRAGSRGAHGLYREFGFAPVGARPGYYSAVGDGPREDALIMWVHDIQSEAYAARLDLVEPRTTKESHDD